MSSSHYMNGSATHVNGVVNGKPTTNGQVNSAVPEKSMGNSARPNIFKRFSDKIISILELGFYKLGYLIGTHPWKTILLVVFITGLLTVGVLKFEETNENDVIWVPDDSVNLVHKRWVDVNFPSTTRFVTVIFEGDVMSEATMNAIYSAYKSFRSLSNSEGNLTSVCIEIRSECWVSSVLELWSYNESTINALTTASIKSEINNNHNTSPLYNTAFDINNVLGEISYDGSNDINQAGAAKMTFFLNGGTEDKEKSKAWEKLAIDLARNGFSGISKTYVYATRSISDENGIAADIKFLSAGYMLVIVFIWIILSRFNRRDQRIALTIAGLFVVGFGLAMSFGLSSAGGWQYGPLHSILPFLLLGIGVDDLFVIHGSLNSLSHHDHTKPVNELTGRMLKHAGVSILVTSVTDVLAFGIGATTTLPALKSFCVYSCVGIVGLFCFSATFFVACVTIDIKRTRQERDGCLCCYRYQAFTPNACSQKNILETFIRKFYAVALLKLPVKIIITIVTAGLLGLNIWAFINLEQDFDNTWFIPSDSYASAYLTAQDKYFPDNGAAANVYCKDIEYVDKKSDFESLYSSLTTSSYIANGTVGSWYKSFTDWLATNPTTYNVGKVAGAPDYWPTSAANFADLLNSYVSTSGAQHKREVVISNSGGTYSIDASYISYRHKLFANAKEEITAMDATQSLVNGLFPGGDCFAYGRFYLTWETNKVIQSELYRNLGLAAACVFVVTIILIANLWTALMVFACVVMTLVDVGGMMHLWGLTVDTVTSINLIIAIGLAVDYSAHIGHCFMTISGERNERVKATLVEMGAPVFSGGFSTFLAFVLLAASTSYVFKTFFKVFFLVVLFGLFHGLTFLPVLLSWIGPSPYLSADKRYQDPEFCHHDDNVQGVDNKAMDMKPTTNGFIKTPPPDYDESQPYIPPPDYTPPPTRNPGRITPLH